MESKILSAAGKVAGLAGLAVGVLLLVFEALLKKQFLPASGLNQSQAFAIMLAVLVFTFGIAGIGLIAWLMAPRDKTTPVPTSALGILSALFVLVLLAAVYVSTQPKSADPTVGSDNKPNTNTTPPPPSTPAKPVDGTWDLQLLCPDGSAMNEFGSQFKQGRYARSFSGPAPGTTELALGYTSEGTVKLTGYVVFDGVGVYAVEATGKISGASVSGTGRFGSTNDCKLLGTIK